MDDSDRTIPKHGHNNPDEAAQFMGGGDMTHQQIYGFPLWIQQIQTTGLL